MLQATLTFEDALAVYTGIGSNDRKVPTRLITRTDFPEAADDIIGLPVPIPYGDLTHTESASAPPAWVQVPARGTSFNGVDWLLGHGDIAEPPAPPTNVAAVPTGSGGSLMLGDVASNTYYVVVTSINAAGTESDPEPFLYDGETAVISANSSKIDVSWTASGSATAYRAYIGMYYFGVRFTQRIQTASTSCTFDKVPAFGVVPTLSNISTGASLLSNAETTYYYAVSALLSDGETPKSVIATHVGGDQAPYRRPVHLEWTTVTGATGYRLYKRPDSSTGYLWRFDVIGATSFDDDLTNATAADIGGVPAPAGILPAVPVGPRLDTDGTPWQAFLIAGCAIKEVTKVYQAGVPIDPGSVGVTFAVPGQTGFSTYFGSTSYVDINGRRYTLLYVRGPLADTTIYGDITVTLKGIEATGDGTGALITSLPQQYEHFLRNFVLRSYETGAWSTTGPTWGDTPNDVDLVDGSSFDDADDVWAARGPGSCPGAWICGVGESGGLEQHTVRTWLARLNLSVDGYGGFSRKSQYVLRMINERASTVGVPTFTATLGINAESFAIEDRPDEIENIITGRYALDAPHGVWAELVVQDVDAQTAIDGEVKPYTLSLWCIRQPGVAYEIANRRLQRRKFPYRRVRWESDMGGLTVDLGDVVKITHPDGAGASGWTDRLVFVTRHEFDADRFVVQFEGLDLTGIIATVDSLPVGSQIESVGADLTPWWLWDGATPAADAA